MTIEQMLEEVNKHCSGKPCDETCLIKETCNRIHGDFRNNFQELHEAMSILRPNDAVFNPSHYTQGGIECIDAMESAFGKEAVENFCMCNAFKYIWRNKHKNGLEDIDKAIWYLNKFKELCKDE